MLGEACADGGLSGDLTDTAQLLISELVTNAVIHGRSPVTVTADLSDGLLRVEVSDDNSRHPELRRADDRALDGRGMHIVDLLAARWGVTDAPLGKVVWFELDSSSAQDARSEATARAG
jgi:anti-sigma regulatory factor (Ser/Thr protein kinase)